MSDAPGGDLGAAAAAGGISFQDLVLLLHGPAASAVGKARSAAEEPVLFRAAASLGFPAGDVAALAPGPAGDGGWQDSLEVNFLGLYGPSSPLPSFWTEEILVQAPGSAPLRDFLDVFNHPLIALAYRVWRHYRLELDAAPDAQDRLSRAALALAGLVVTPDVATVLEPVRLLPLCGLLSQHARSAPVLVQVLEGYFGIAVAVEEFQPRFVSIPPSERFQLGQPAATLGIGAVLGESVPDVGGSVTLRLGPLDRIGFAAFLPGGSKRAALEALVQLVLREPLACLVELQLRAAANDDFTLGNASLGWFSWLAGGGTDRSCPAGSF